MSYLDSDNYPAFMFLALTIVSIFILFSFILIFQNSQIEITGLAINEINDTNQTDEEIEVYSTKAYTIFYAVLTGLIVFIAILSISVLMPILKNYT